MELRAKAAVARVMLRLEEECQLKDCCRTFMRSFVDDVNRHLVCISRNSI
jgi:hypothetical protein